MRPRLAQARLWRKNGLIVEVIQQRKLVQRRGNLERRLQRHLVLVQLSERLAERVSIRDLPAILEAIAEALGHTKNVLLITEHVRARLARQLCHQHLSHQGFLPIIAMSPAWEQSFAESLIGNGEERQLAMAPTQLQAFIQTVRDRFDDAAAKGEVPVLLTSPMVRPYVRSVIERFRAQTPVMSQNEIHPSVRLRTMGQI